jgi:hypothetical protein
MKVRKNLSTVCGPNKNKLPGDWGILQPGIWHAWDSQWRIQHFCGQAYRKNTFGRPQHKYIVTIRGFKVKKWHTGYNFTEAIPLCDNINVYVFTSDTTIIKYTNRSATKLKVLGHIFRPRCSHLLTNLYRSSTFNVRTIWDPIMCTIMIYVCDTNHC